MKLPIAAKATCHDARTERSRPMDEFTETSRTVFRIDTGIDIERRFLTILFADVVNYSRLVEIDDLKTILHLERLRLDIIRPIAESHSADIVRNFGGDGMVVSFTNPVLAVRCAIDLQKQTKSHERSWSVDERIRFRIGIAMGSVLLVNGSLHGGPINVAARLQSLAAPGDIWIAEPVAKQVHDKAGIAFEALGKLRLKNIEESVGAHRVTLKCESRK